MEWKKEWKPLLIILSVFLLCFYIPVGNFRFDNAIREGFFLVNWYAREHVILCLVPAFFIAGAISVFISQDSVMKYLGSKANQVLAYLVASVSGTVLAVCSCTVLPIFAGIYKRGAGIGPATAFLYSGPAINVLAIIMTARVLGFELGIARAVGAIFFSIIIGLLMHFIFRKEEAEKVSNQIELPESDKVRHLWKDVIYFGLMIGILVFSNWAKSDNSIGVWFFIYTYKWAIVSILSLFFAIILIEWFELKLTHVILASLPVAILGMLFPNSPLIAFSAGIVGLSIITSKSKGETSDWFSSSWEFAKQITPLLLIGVFLSGIFLGRPAHEGLIPSEWIVSLVGSNSILSNFFASVVGAFMYFATLTEIPILQGLIANGMHKGPALALLLAGPALSLPSMLVLNSIMGLKKTVVYISLVVVMATFTGFLFGLVF